MPKQVDHEERRRQLAEAVCRLAGTRGLEAVTLRHVAAEAGVSMGLVQHYFTTKDQMLLFAFQTMSKRVERRIGEVVTALPQPLNTRLMLRALLAAMLPLDEESRAEAPLWIAFLARAIIEPRLADPLRESGTVLSAFIEEQIRKAQEEGEVLAGLDPRLEATTLLVLMDGLLIHSLMHSRTADVALATLDYHLDRIFAGELIN